MSGHEPWCERAHTADVVCSLAARWRWIAANDVSHCPKGRNGYHGFESTEVPMGSNTPCRYGCGAVLGDLEHEGLRAWKRQITTKSPYYPEGGTDV